MNSFKIPEDLVDLYEIYLKYVQLKPTRIWTREIYTEEERQTHGFFEKGYQIIKQKDPQEFKKITRMNVPTFNMLFGFVKNKLEKTSIRRPIEPECRLVLTLMFLAQGAKWQSLAWLFRMGVSTVRSIALETSQNIWDELNLIYLAPPNESEWKRISTDFFNMTGLPNCVGAIDGKHIKIRCPAHSGSLYFNYKSFYSIVLLGACDSNYCFTAVDIGAYGSQSDGGVLQLSAFGSKLLKNEVGLPPKSIVRNTNIELPYFFVADAAFPLRMNIMRPYPGRLLPDDKGIFNKTLSRARSKIENTFGILTMRWRVLQDGLQCFPENALKIVQAVVVLHNFVKMHDGEYCPINAVDHFDDNNEINGLWRESTKPLPQTKLFTRYNAPKEAFAVRDTLKNYLTEKNST